MNKKKIIQISLGLFGALLLVGYIARIYEVNSNLDRAELVIYEEGEWAEFGEDYINTDGYTPGYRLKLNGYEIVTPGELRRKYLPDMEEEYFDAQYYVLVDAVARNDGSETSEEYGIELIEYMLVGTTYVVLEDSWLFDYLNPDLPGDAFSLRAGTELEFVIPYSIGENDRVTRDELQSELPSVMITEYPHRKMLRI